MFFFRLVKIPQPPLRPKGMGLGADKLTKQDTNVKPAVDRDGKVLSCVKGAYVKVIAGYHKGSYGQVSLNSNFNSIKFNNYFIFLDNWFR